MKYTYYAISNMKIQGGGDKILCQKKYENLGWWRGPGAAAGATSEGRDSQPQSLLPCPGHAANADSGADDTCEKLLI